MPECLIPLTYQSEIIIKKGAGTIVSFVGLIADTASSSAFCGVNLVLLINIVIIDNQRNWTYLQYLAYKLYQKTMDKQKKVPSQIRNKRFT